MRQCAAGCCPELDPKAPTSTPLPLLQVVLALVYLCLYAVHMFNTFKQLSARPYQQARLSNCLFRIQVS